MGEEKRRKLARDAGNDENCIPGSHGPVQAEVVGIMEATLDALWAHLPGWQFTLFSFEPNGSRYNYMSTADRPDMVAVLKAFVARNSEMEAIDKAMAGEAKGRG